MREALSHRFEKSSHPEIIPATILGRRTPSGFASRLCFGAADSARFLSYVVCHKSHSPIRSHALFVWLPAKEGTPPDLAHLFRRFYQVANSSSRGTTGIAWAEDLRSCIRACIIEYQAAASNRRSPPLQPKSRIPLAASLRFSRIKEKILHGCFGFRRPK